MSDQRELIIWILPNQPTYDIPDDSLSLGPTLIKSRMYTASFTLLFRASGRIWNIFLLREGQVGDSVGDRVSSAKCNDDAGKCGGMRESYISARVLKCYTSIPSLLEYVSST